MSDLEKQLRQMLSNKLQNTILKLAAMEVEKLETPQHWEGWQNRTTYRRNGEVIRGGDRNIVDTGELRNSIDVDYDSARLSGTITFDAAHAAQVYIGDVGKPGRPWHEDLMADINYEEGVRQIFKDS